MCLQPFTPAESKGSKVILREPDRGPFHNTNTDKTPESSLSLLIQSNSAAAKSRTPFGVAMGTVDYVIIPISLSPSPQRPGACMPKERELGRERPGEPSGGYLAPRMARDNTTIHNPSCLFQPQQCGWNPLHLETVLTLELWVSDTFSAQVVMDDEGVLSMSWLRVLVCLCTGWECPCL